MKKKITYIEVIISIILIVIIIRAYELWGGMRKAPNTELVTSVLNETHLVASYNKFGFKLYSELSKEKSEQNLLISPANIAMALSMAYNGADGETKSEMAKVLDINDITLEDLNKSNKVLIQYLENINPDVELAIANSLWCNSDVKFEPNFIKRCKDNYFAEASNDLNEETINNWIDKNTKGKTKKITIEKKTNEYLYLLSATYFKGNWAKEFKKDDTKEGDFHLIDGTIKKHPMMYQSEKCKYYEEKSFQAVELPYKNGNFSMYIFLPAENSNIKTFRNSLTYKNWSEWMAKFFEVEVRLIIPRFKFECEQNLKKSLDTLGIKKAFKDTKADFRNMIINNPEKIIYIDKILHRTYIQVNEESTEAKAVVINKYHIATGSSGYFYMIVDRPFFFAITENTTGTILFMGTVMEPFE